MVTFAIDPRKTAVVAVDLQNCSVEKSPIAAPLGLQVVDKLNLLAARYRAAGSTIIWTRHAVRPDHSDVGILGKTVPPGAQGVIDDGAPSAALHPKVVVQAGDIILAKPHRYSGRHHTSRSGPTANPSDSRLRVCRSVERRGGLRKAAGDPNPSDRLSSRGSLRSKPRYDHCSPKASFASHRSFSS